MRPLTDRVAYHTMKGRRASNQDAVVVGMMADGRGMAAVADGMGGRLGGDVASRRALEVVVERLGAGEGVTKAIRAANRTVFAESGADPELHGMGTTVVALVQDGEEYHIANVGDSRAYRLSGDGISRVTADHSFTAEAVEAGDMTPEDAVHSPWANALTRAIGTDEDVEVDVFGPFDARESHAILLCSDGFHKPLSDEGILTSVLGCDPLGAAEELTDIALRAGSDDNITIALVSFGDGSWRDAAVRARQDTWEMDDAPTVEFQNECDGDLEASKGSAEETLASDLQDEAPPEGRSPEWILPEPDDPGEKPEAGHKDISGSIHEGLAPLSRAMAAEGSAIEVLAQLHDVPEGTAETEGAGHGDVGAETLEGPGSEVGSQTSIDASSDFAGNDLEGLDEEVAGEVTGDPDPPEITEAIAVSEPPASAGSNARPQSKRRRSVGGFDLMVSPAKPQRRFKSRSFFTPVALLAAIGVVVALLIRFL